jgi:hypothetical protein
MQQAEVLEDLLVEQADVFLVLFLDLVEDVAAEALEYHLQQAEGNLLVLGFKVKMVVLVEDLLTMENLLEAAVEE